MKYKRIVDPTRRVPATSSQGDVLYPAARVLSDPPISILSFGGDPTGATSSAAALAAYEATLPGGVNGGGEMIFPEGSFDIGSWAPTKYNVRLRGAGRRATRLFSSVVGVYLLSLQNDQGPRWHASDIWFDANSKCDCALWLGATTPSTGNVFDCCYFSGALVDTVRLGAVGGSNDVSFNHFRDCSLDSASPSNSNLRVAGSNTAQNIIEGGTLGPNGSFPQNVDSVGAATIFRNVYFYGATQYEIKVAGGTIIVDGGDTESPTAFLHTLSTDVLGYDYPPHSIKNFILSGVSASPADVYIYHEAKRLIYFDNVAANRSVRIGAQGRITRHGLTFFDPASKLIFDAGAQIGNLPLLKIYKGSNQSIPNGVETEVTFDAEIIDTFAMHDNVTNNSRFTVPTGCAGWYRVLAQIHFDGTGLGTLLQAIFKKNGGLYTGGRAAVSATGSANIFQIEDLIFLEDGATADWGSLLVTQSSGGALDLIGGGLTSTCVMVYYLGMSG